MLDGVKAIECMPAEAIMQETARLSARWNRRHKALGGELGSLRVLLLQHLAAVPTVHDWLTAPLRCMDD